MNKKAQEEMIGFVLIVVLIVVIALVFLGINLRSGEKTDIKSKNIQNLLQSLEQITTKCQTTTEYLDIQDLTKECVDKGVCNEEKACDVLKHELSEILDKSLPAGTEYPINAYKLIVNYNDTRIIHEILEIRKEDYDDCKGKKIGAEYYSPANFGNIITKLQVCYGE